jgi:hypothetical protein
MTMPERCNYLCPPHLERCIKERGHGHPRQPGDRQDPCCCRHPECQIERELEEAQWRLPEAPKEGRDDEQPSD